MTKDLCTLMSASYLFHRGFVVSYLRTFRRGALMLLTLLCIQPLWTGYSWGQESTEYVGVDCDQSADRLEIGVLSSATSPTFGQSGTYDLSKYLLKPIKKQCKLKIGVLTAEIEPRYVCKNDPPTFSLTLRKAGSREIYIDHVTFNESCDPFTDGLSIRSMVVSGATREITVVGLVRSIPFRAVSTMKSSHPIVASAIKPDRISENPNADLLLASLRGEVDSVMTALDRRADVETKNGIGETSLMLAVERNNFGVVKELVLHGADVNAHDLGNGVPVLMRAVRHKSAEVVRYLVQHGARPDEPSDYAGTALNWAAGIGNAEVVNALLELKADPNTVDSFGFTVLLRAIMQSPLYVGSKEDYNRVIQLLVSHGCKVNVVSGNGETAIAMAIKNPWTTKETMELMLSRNADKSEIGRAIVVAEREGRNDLLYVIKNNGGR